MTRNELDLTLPQRLRKSLRAALDKLGNARLMVRRALEKREREVEEDLDKAAGIARHNRERAYNERKRKKEEKEEDGDGEG